MKGGISVPDFLAGLGRFDLSNLEGVDVVKRFTELVMGEIESVDEDCIPDLMLETALAARGFPDEQAEPVRRLITSCLVKLIRGGKRDVSSNVLRKFIESEAPIGLFLDQDVGVEIGRGGEELVSLYSDLILRIPLEFPKVKGFSSNTWEEIVDPEHISQISVLMRIIASNIGGFEPLIRRLVCHVRFGGVLIKDNSIFPREISRFLNYPRNGSWITVYRTIS